MARLSTNVGIAQGELENVITTYRKEANFENDVRAFYKKAKEMVSQRYPESHPDHKKYLALLLEEAIEKKQTTDRRKMALAAYVYLKQNL